MMHYRDCRRERSRLLPPFGRRDARSRVIPANEETMWQCGTRKPLTPAVIGTGMTRREDGKSLKFEYCGWAWWWVGGEEKVVFTPIRLLVRNALTLFGFALLDNHLTITQHNRTYQLLYKKSKEFNYFGGSAFLKSSPLVIKIFNTCRYVSLKAIVTALGNLT